MSEIIIIGFDLSNYTRAARLACAEKGVPHTLSPEGLTGVADFRSPMHLARHPFGRIPVLKHGDRLVFETTAIGRYIDSKFDGPDLFGGDADEEVELEQWSSAVNYYLDRPLIRETVIPYLFPSGPDGKPDRARIDAALPLVRDALRGLETGLSRGSKERPFFGGNRPKMPDLLLLPMVDALFAFPEGAGMLAENPGVRRFHEAFSKRPSYAATLPKERPQASRAAAAA